MNILNYNARRIPSPHGEFVLLAVLVQNDWGRYIVYEGIVADNSIEDPYYEEVTEWVARYGRKLSHDSAIGHFPNLSPNNYGNW